MGGSRDDQGARLAALNHRKILCVSPVYARSFGTFEHAYSFRGSRAFMPPQGLLVIAASLPEAWEVRFIDENIAPAHASDFVWADAVFVSGMHVQRRAINELCGRAHSFGKTTVLGGPSVSACPEHYPDFDYIHIGELGDATGKVIAALDRDPRRPGRQQRFDTAERTPLEAFPIPAYQLAQLDRYFINNVQFSSGCPYQCEFCDIPALYGRNPRLKSPEQVTRELDTMLDAGAFGAAYFVDDNFIGNRRAARELTEELIRWQKKRGYPLSFSCEATLNISKHSELLKLMREANFNTIFCGIETPELGALQAMKKGHNAVLPIYESIATLNSYGFEIVSGIILGLDTDTEETPAHILDFIRRSNIPMLTINLLQALPRTALYDRLARENRIVEDDSLESNVVFRRPYDDVVSAWRNLIAEAYEPSALYARYAWNVEHTYPNRLHPDAGGRATLSNVAYGMKILANVFVRVGGLSNYRKVFWDMAWPLIKAGRIEEVIHVGLVAHHLIKFSREAVSGAQNASFYAPAERAAA
ncbi:MAG TPA: B12-binding domain-containing radical SAM protein [Rhizomicrobium sp.]|nr:B12-binding domain-containing radical SAM protein [Rhizomicrobium sp.]